MPRQKASPNRSDFIRDNIALSAAEIIDKAKAAGLGVIKPGLVYTVKSQVQKAQAPKTQKAAKTPKAAQASKTPKAAKEPKKAAKAAKATKAKVGKTPAASPAPATTAAATAGRPNASVFVKSLPVDMPVEEVMVKARAAGYTFPPGFVKLTRNAGRKSDKTGGKRKATTKAAKARPVVAATAPVAVATGATSGGKKTPSDFVRSVPVTLSAKEVQVMGAKQGLKFSTALVYAVRKASLKKKGAVKAAPAAPAAQPAPSAAAPTPKAKPGPKPKVTPSSPVVGSSHESTFRKLAVDLGLVRAWELLADVERKLEALFGAK